MIIFKVGNIETTKRRARKLYTLTYPQTRARYRLRSMFGNRYKDQKYATFSKNPSYCEFGIVRSQDIKLIVWKKL